MVIPNFGAGRLQYAVGAQAHSAAAVQHRSALNASYNIEKQLILSQSQLTCRMCVSRPFWWLASTATCSRKPLRYALPTNGGRTNV